MCWQYGNENCRHAALPAMQQIGKEKIMHTVAILSQKGGTGKTTLTLHLAVASEKANKQAVVIDLDPQASAAGWKDSRQDEAPVVVSVPSTRLPQALHAAYDGGANLALIDTAPHASEVALAAAEAADLVLIPCRAGILDLRAISTTARAVKLAGKRAYVVLNAVPPRASNILADARATVAVHNLQVAPLALQQRAAYAHALTAGQTAQEYEPEGKAAEEISRLYDWLKCELR
jgi:chromosome partitioning protein